MFIVSGAYQIILGVLRDPLLFRLYSADLSPRDIASHIQVCP